MHSVVGLVRVVVKGRLVTRDRAPHSSCIHARRGFLRESRLGGALGILPPGKVSPEGASEVIDDFIQDLLQKAGAWRSECEAEDSP